MKFKLVLLFLIFLCVVPHVRAQIGQGLLGDSSLYWIFNLLFWIILIYALYKMYSMLKRIEKKVGAAQPDEPRMLQRVRPKDKILFLGICIVIVLSFVVLVFGVSTLDQNSDAAWLLLLLGTIGIVLSVSVLLRGRKTTAKSPWPAIVTQAEKDELFASRATTEDRAAQEKLMKPEKEEPPPLGLRLKCGTEHSEDANYCNNCGSPLKK